MHGESRTCNRDGCERVTSPVSRSEYCSNRCQHTAWRDRYKVEYGHTYNSRHGELMEALKHFGPIVAFQKTFEWKDYGWGQKIKVELRRPRYFFHQKRCNPEVIVEAYRADKERIMREGFTQ